MCRALLGGCILGLVAVLASAGISQESAADACGKAAPQHVIPECTRVIENAHTTETLRIRAFVKRGLAYGGRRPGSRHR
jgi:hypothetical protein